MLSLSANNLRDRANERDWKLFELYCGPTKPRNATSSPDTRQRTFRASRNFSPTDPQPETTPLVHPDDPSRPETQFSPRRGAKRSRLISELCSRREAINSRGFEPVTGRIRCCLYDCIIRRSIFLIVVVHSTVTLYARSETLRIKEKRKVEKYALDRRATHIAERCVEILNNLRNGGKRSRKFPSIGKIRGYNRRNRGKSFGELSVVICSISVPCDCVTPKEIFFYSGIKIYHT